MAGKFYLLGSMLGDLAAEMEWGESRIVRGCVLGSAGMAGLAFGILIGLRQGLGGGRCLNPGQNVREGQVGEPESGR